MPVLPLVRRARTRIVGADTAEGILGGAVCIAARLRSVRVRVDLFARRRFDRISAVRAKMAVVFYFLPQCLQYIFSPF